MVPGPLLPEKIDNAGAGVGPGGAVVEEGENARGNGDASAAGRAVVEEAEASSGTDDACPAGRAELL